MSYARSESSPLAHHTHLHYKSQSVFPITSNQDAASYHIPTAAVSQMWLSWDYSKFKQDYASV